MKVSKLTQEEINNLDIIKQRTEFILKEFGQISIIKLSLEDREAQAKDFLLKTREMEKQVAEYLEKKYGKGSIDIDKGEFTSI